VKMQYFAAVVRTIVINIMNDRLVTIVGRYRAVSFLVLVPQILYFFKVHLIS
jgi:hypothetical protein